MLPPDPVRHLAMQVPRGWRQSEPVSGPRDSHSVGGSEALGSAVSRARGCVFDLKGPERRGCGLWSPGGGGA